ncbi:MAG: hypothetical protein KGJ41_17885 [Rhodospirillales bacterium]|nr:hypothetical protein [Rhodospirillales bacterium]
MDRRNTKVMSRADLTRRLVGMLDRQEAVIGGIGYTNSELWGAGHRPQNFYMLGSMGLACPIAFGVALAQPDRLVFALEGDGSMLMQLGALATIAAHAPKNLTIILMDNAAYQITGGQKTATAARADLVEIARGAGMAQSSWAADEDDFELLVRRARDGEGPWLIGARIDNQLPKLRPERTPTRIKDWFMAGMKPA